MGPPDLAVALGRDDDLDTTCSKSVGEMIGILAFVGDDGIGVDTINQVMGQGDVVALAGRADQANREPERLSGRVDLGAQAAARATQALGIRPPLTLRVPAACW